MKPPTSPTSPTSPTYTGSSSVGSSNDPRRHHSTPGASTREHRSTSTQLTPPPQSNQTRPSRSRSVEIRNHRRVSMRSHYATSVNPSSIATQLLSTSVGGGGGDVSADEIRRQTLSWTYRELYLNSSYRPSGASPEPIPFFTGTSASKRTSSSSVPSFDQHFLMSHPTSPTQQPLPTLKDKSSHRVSTGSEQSFYSSRSVLPIPDSRTATVPPSPILREGAKESNITKSIARSRQGTSSSSGSSSSLSNEFSIPVNREEQEDESPQYLGRPPPTIIRQEHVSDDSSDLERHTWSEGFGKPVYLPSLAPSPEHDADSSPTMVASSSTKRYEDHERVSEVLPQAQTSLKDHHQHRKPRQRRHEQSRRQHHQQGSRRAESQPPSPPFSLKQLFTPLQVIPAVILGIILNLLDALSYGILIFPPTNPLMPHGAREAGVSMFLVSTIVAQVCYTFTSQFPGANGSMMIEVMPFLHIIANTITAQLVPLGADQKAIISTILIAYALSTIFTGLAFILLGGLKLGSVVAFFPRHILVGTIAGIGVFLLFTALEVTTGTPVAYTMEFLHFLFEARQFKLWFTALSLALFLKLIQRRFGHPPLLTPMYYLFVPFVFYGIMSGILGMGLDELREQGWLFDLDKNDHGTPPSSLDSVAEDTSVHWYTFYTWIDFSLVHWRVIPKTFGTMAALVFFGILHVPINVPALAVSTNRNVSVNKELLSHGFSNLLAGLVGSTQNYLVYSNSLLYIRSGGAPSLSTDNTPQPAGKHQDHRERRKQYSQHVQQTKWNDLISKFGSILLAFGTFSVMTAGKTVISVVPSVVVGSLIFLLGIELCKEGLVDTFRRVHVLEYTTILIIVTIMTTMGFTEGILAGIILANTFFVFIYSRKTIVRSIKTGQSLRSTVHRLTRQQVFLDHCAHLIRIIQLQGYLFFGTIRQLNKFVRGVVKTKGDDTRFIVLDFGMVTGIDYSALEAFIRLRSDCAERGIEMVVCGWATISEELFKIGLFDTHDAFPVHAFSTLNEALEWSENRLLQTFYERAAARRGWKHVETVDEYRHGVDEEDIPPAVDEDRMALFPKRQSPTAMSINGKEKEVFSGLAPMAQEEDEEWNRNSYDESRHRESVFMERCMTPREQQVMEAADLALNDDPLVSRPIPSHPILQQTFSELFHIPHAHQTKLRNRLRSQYPNNPSPNLLNATAADALNTTAHQDADFAEEQHQQQQRHIAHRASFFASDTDELHFYNTLATLFIPTFIAKDTILWNVDDEPCYAFLVERGVLVVCVTREPKEKETAMVTDNPSSSSKNAKGKKRRKRGKSVGCLPSFEYLKGYRPVKEYSSDEEEASDEDREHRRDDYDAMEQGGNERVDPDSEDLVGHEKASKEKELVIVETLIPGTMVGELNLLTNRPHTTRLVAAEDTVVWRMDKEKLDAWLEQDPKNAVKFVKLVLSFDVQRLQNVLALTVQLVS